MILFILITHGLAAFFLWGESMAALFDGQTAWREKLSMDDSAVSRLGNAVTRLGVSLPLVLIWALAPKAGRMAIGAAAAVMLAAAGVLRLRTWGLFAMLGSAGLLVGSVLTAPTVAMTAEAWTPVGAPLALLAAALLVAERRRSSGRSAASLRADRLAKPTLTYPVRAATLIRHEGFRIALIVRSRRLGDGRLPAPVRR